MAVLGMNQSVEFEDDRLLLDIPMTGTKAKGWRIVPSFNPTVSWHYELQCGVFIVLCPLQIIKKHVDMFKPGQRIPHCHLKAEVTSKGEKTVSKLFHQVKLVGAKEPFNVVTFTLDTQLKQPGEC